MLNVERNIIPKTDEQFMTRRFQTYNIYSCAFVCPSNLRWSSIFPIYTEIAQMVLLFFVAPPLSHNGFEIMDCGLFYTIILMYEHYNVFLLYSSFRLLIHFI